MGTVKKHLLIHSNRQKLQCDKCDYQTRDKAQLKRHMFSHEEDQSEGRKFICNICQKTWFTKQSLKEHLMVHAGIKPYKCNLCNGAFSNYSGHRQHMMKTVRLSIHYVFETDEKKIHNHDLTQLFLLF